MKYPPEDINKAGKYYSKYGLFLRIEPTGTKRWAQRLTLQGKQIEIGLGPYDLFTHEETLEHAKENKRLAWSGEMPIKRNGKPWSLG